MIHFLLTPDRSSSLALKRRVAEQGARDDVVIGTWPELLTLAQNCHILPTPQGDWQERLTAAIRAPGEAFWAESLKNVPAEEEAVVAMVGQHLTLLLEGLGTERSLEALAGAAGTGRPGRRVRDFIALHAAMGQLLPPELAAIREMLAAPPERVLRAVRVYRRDGWPRLNPWQRALIDTLNRRADSPSPELATLLETLPASPSAPADSLLGHLQANLFTVVPKGLTETRPRDATVQWLGCRDCLQEAEIAAGMVQRAMADEPALAFSDFALLLPRDERYLQAVDECFAAAGLPLAGLERETALRDPGREAVHYFLLGTRGLAPSMALATLLTSPLMPWDAQVGNRLAQKVAEGDFNVRLPDDAETGHQAMLALVRQRVASAAELAGLLPKFVKQLRICPEYDHPLVLHRRRAEEAVKILQRILAARPGPLTEAVWHDLLHACQPQPLSSSAAGSLTTREGVAVFHEGGEPWRRVRRLLVLGCGEGHYPAPAARSPVFFDADLAALRETCGLEIETAGERGVRLREVFRRQLCAATDEVTFLLPRRDRMGKALAPSPALAFMASLITGVKDADKLIIDLDGDYSEARGLAMAPEREADAPWAPVVADLELGADLVALRSGAESPSRLEKLMISPLVWLLERMNIKPQEWQPEALDVSMKGKLAHLVFEELFARGKSLPDEDGIEAQVPGLLKTAVTKICPYLHAPEWNVERHHLEQEIIRAARRWSEILRELGATVVGNEISLKGTLPLGAQKPLPVHGDADLLLELSDGRLLVVDYKKSSSKDRRLRMQEGYDHQATLYGTMIRTGGPEYPEKVSPKVVEILARYRDSGEIRSLYYLMNDQQVLTDSNGWFPADFPGQPEMGDGNSRAAQ
ncbi:MAG: hypothetical protein FIB02_02600, partial [Desulfuromonas sp.]|nr:hypothetical protein [Desulfuromonas sp.]